MAKSSRPDSVPWDSLSVEAKRALLFRVPCHDLCRLRVVCKAWDRLIRQPEFAFLHAKSAHRWSESCMLSSTRKLIMSIIGPRMSSMSSTINVNIYHQCQCRHQQCRRPVVTENDPGWQLLDIGANRVFTIPDTFIREALLGGAPPGTNVRRHTLAASGGLILAVYGAENWSSFNVLPRVVCNPVSRSFHRIPPPPGKYHKLVGMVVDAATQRYRIVHFRGESPYSPAAAPAYEVLLYDSWVRGWRKLCDAPSAAHRPRSCVVLHGVLHAMFEDVRDRRNELYTCNLVTGEWRLIDIALPRPPIPLQAGKSRSQVVAAAGRLFFVGCSGEDRISVSVWKIFGESRPRVTLVAQLPRFLAYHRSTLHPATYPVVVVGCGDSIVVSDLVGRCVRWDVLRGTWYRSMAPMITGGSGAACHSFFVSAIDLQMRPMPPQ